MLRKTKYLVRESIRTIRRHKVVTSISVVIMSLSLLMLAVFLLATDNLLKVIGQAQREVQVHVYLDDRVAGARIERLHHELLAMTEVESVVYVSKDEALADFRGQFGEDDDLLKALGTNPLPNSFRLTIKDEYKNGPSMANLAARVAQIQGIEEVRYGKEFVEKFARIIRGVYYVDAVVGFIVLLSAVFIISNAVRLTVISRRRTIEILKLVGATDRFVTLPFVIEGAMQGGAAALISLALLFGVTLVTRKILPDLSFFSVEKSAVYLLTCILIAAIGSLAALRRFLKV